MKSFFATVRDFHAKLSPDFSRRLKFSEQSKSLQDQNLATLKIAIDLLSVHDPVAMLQKLLSSSEYKPAANATMDTKYSQCLENICQLFNRASNREDKKMLLSLVANLHDANFLRDIGFIFGHDLFSQARKYTRYVVFFNFILLINVI